MPQRSHASTQATRQDSFRLFFALWPDEALRRNLYKATRAVVATADGRPVPASNLHMTLAFLGQVAAKSLDAVRNAAAAVKGEAFRMELDEVGYWNGPQVLWCGARRVPDALKSLVETLRARLTAAGLDPDSKSFVPHVTLARNVRLADLPGRFDPIHWDAQDFVLVRSLTGERGSQYSPIATYALVGGGIVK